MHKQTLTFGQGKQMNLATELPILPYTKTVRWLPSDRCRTFFHPDYTVGVGIAKLQIAKQQRTELMFKE